MTLDKKIAAIYLGSVTSIAIVITWPLILLFVFGGAFLLSLIWAGGTLLARDPEHGDIYL